MNTLTGIQEDVLLGAYALFGMDTFDLAQTIIPAYRPYQIRDALDEMVELGIVRGFPTLKNHWELNGIGLEIAGALSGVREKIVENRERKRAAEIANPRPLRKLTKDTWEKRHHYAIIDLLAELREGKWEDNMDEADEFYATCLYTDGAKFVLKIGVTLADILKEAWDTRFTHVLIIYPNAEDK